MDSLVAIELITFNKVANDFLRTIVDDYMCLLWEFEQFKLQHIYREANSCVNILTKAGCTQKLEFFFLYPFLKDSAKLKFKACAMPNFYGFGLL